MHPPLPGKPRLCALAIQIPYKTPSSKLPNVIVAWFQGQTANRMGLLHNSILQKFPLSKIRNSGENHEIIVVSTAKILGCFSKKAILQQPFFGGKSCLLVRQPLIYSYSSASTSSRVGMARMAPLRVVTM